MNARTDVWTRHGVSMIGIWCTHGRSSCAISDLVRMPRKYGLTHKRNEWLQNQLSLSGAGLCCIMNPDTNFIDLAVNKYGPWRGCPGRLVGSPPSFSIYARILPCVSHCIVTITYQRQQYNSLVVQNLRLQFFKHTHGDPTRYSNITTTKP